MQGRNGMIEIRGTSHIASGDLEDIGRLVREREPDVVALELDINRLGALLGESGQTRVRNPFLLLLKILQGFLGKHTGAVPGSDMLKAFETAESMDIPVALIDQDISTTVKKLRGVTLLEKIKFFGYLLLGYFITPTADIDLREVPEEDVIEEMLFQFRVSFPGMYSVLVEERNDIMAERLRELEREYGHVLAFVGAGHVEGIEEILQS